MVSLFARLLRSSLMALPLVTVAPLSALADNSCLKNAFELMAGNFDATGKKTNAQGDLEPFNQKYSASLEDETGITFLFGGIKYGTWRLSEGSYVFITYDKNGTPIGKPISVEYKCEAKDAVINLSEEWLVTADREGKKWKMLQVRRIKPNTMEVALYARDPNSTDPPVVITVYTAERQ